MHLKFDGSVRSHMEHLPRNIFAVPAQHRETLLRVSRPPAAPGRVKGEWHRIGIWHKNLTIKKIILHGLITSSREQPWTIYMISCQIRIHGGAVQRRATSGWKDMIPRAPLVQRVKVSLVQKNVYKKLFLKKNIKQWSHLPNLSSWNSHLKVFEGKQAPSIAILNNPDMSGSRSCRTRL
jgi:hypothetical protein